MDYPVFIFHELTYRLSQINPNIGTFDSSTVRNDIFVIHTTTGELEVDREIIGKQYQNPRLLSREDLYLLTKKFHTLD
jgi:hypothetical protein